MLHAECDYFIRSLDPTSELQVGDCHQLITLMYKFADVVPSLMSAPYLKLLSLWRQTTFIGSLEILSLCSALPSLDQFARQVIGHSADSQGVILIKSVYEAIIPFVQDVLQANALRETSLLQQIEQLEEKIESFDIGRINEEWSGQVQRQAKLTAAAEQKVFDTLEKVGFGSLSSKRTTRKSNTLSCCASMPGRTLTLKEELMKKPRAI